MEQINRYILIKKGNENPPNITKQQDQEDTEEIMKYQQIYDQCAIDKLYQIENDIKEENKKNIIQMKKLQRTKVLFLVKF